jgi:hypothetical protein
MTATTKAPRGMPPELGRLLSPQEVAQTFFDGQVTPAWVRTNVRPRVEINQRVIRYYEADVAAWIASRRVA